MNGGPDFNHIRAAPVILLLLTTLLVASTSAQDAVNQPNDAGTQNETDRITVTGSYIPTQTAAEVGPNPIQLLDRETIEKSGERNTEHLLRDLPVANANS